MLTVTSDDVVRMKDALFFDGDQRSRKLTQVLDAVAAVCRDRHGRDHVQLDGHGDRRDRRGDVMRRSPWPSSWT